MYSKTSSQQKSPVLPVLEGQPCISVIMPFNPKMITRHELAVSIKKAYKQVRKDLHEKYPAAIANELLDKL